MESHIGLRIDLISMASYDAHPMSMLTSAFAMLGSYYSEANPSLQGKTLHDPCSALPR